MLHTILRVLREIAALLRGPYSTPLIKIPGIGAAVAYASGDAFGTMFELPAPRIGTIESLMFYDVDDEGLAKTLLLYTGRIEATTDNDPMAVNDSDIRLAIGHIQLEAADYEDFGTSRLGTVRKINLSYEAPDRKVYGQWMTRGADNIAAGSEPLFRLQIRPHGGD